MKNRFTIRFINDLLNNKKISCYELTKKYIDEIKKVNPKLNAYVTVTEELAFYTAKKVDEKISKGFKLDLLEGVPMTLKDNISTKGVRTTGCSKMLENYVPIYDATVWEILKNQNAVMLGKTNMDEFALGSSCRTSYFGGALNPYDTSKVAGGSSGGVASAVGGNIAVYGLGSDTGGSIREPASFCGIVGLKPTYGTFSRYGLFAYASSFDQIGPMTANVEDASILFDALAKKDPKDPTSKGNMGNKTFDTLNKDIKGLKIGIVKQYFDNSCLEVHNSIQNAIDIYKSLGAEMVYIDMPIVKYALPIYYILSCVEGASNFARFDGVRYGYRTKNYVDFNDMVSKSRGEAFGSEVKRRILLGAFMQSKNNFDRYYKKAVELRKVICLKFEEVFKKCDVLLSPTATKTAFETDHKYADPVEGYMSDICLVPVNIIGACAVSVPSGFSKDGLPIGLQIIGDKFCESKILNVAYQFEKTVDYENYKEVKMGVTR